MFANFTDEYIAEVCSSMFDLMNGTKSWVSASVQNNKDKAAYEKTIERCIRLCQVVPNSPEKMKQVLLNAKEGIEHERSFLNWFSDPKSYRILAVDHCIDIVDSIEKRFL